MNTKDELTIRLNHVILIKGFQKMSMSKLAEAINVSRATLYIYFKNKDDIVNAVVDRQFLFIKQHPIPTDFNSADFLSILLNSLLLDGSTTETFTNELRKNYPELFAKFQRSSENYFDQLKNYYQLAIDQSFISNEFLPEFIIFQNRTGIRAILNAVLNHDLTVSKAEVFLNSFFDLQITGFLTKEARQKIDVISIESFKKTIFSEYRATYSLLS